MKASLRIRRSVGWLASGLKAACLCALLAAPAHAVTTYTVHIHVPAMAGNPGAMAFDFTSSNFSSNSVNVLDFQHSGTFGLHETQGGFISGDLILGANPAFFTEISDYDVLGGLPFFTELVVNFDPMSTQTRFMLDLTEDSFGETSLFDEFSFFLLDHTQQPIPTADPLGADALFAIGITGDEGGDLTFFAPMEFHAPDTLMLGPSLVDVGSQPFVDRLRFRTAAPNPSPGEIRFDYDVPAPGGAVRLRVFDMAGRLVREVLDRADAPGLNSAVWRGIDREGRRVAPGVYLVRLDLAGQSVVRRVVLVR